MGACGHNSAYAILEDLKLAKLARSHIPRPKITDRALKNRHVKKLSYRIARQPAFDKLLGAVSRVPIPEPATFPSPDR